MPEAEMSSERSALRFILAGAGLGLVVPLALRLVSMALDVSPEAPVSVLTAFDYVQLMLWPTTLLLVPLEEPGAPDLSSWGLIAIATLANVTAYATLAGLVWLGLVKSRVLLLLPVL